MNYLKTSQGERISRAKFDYRVRKAKERKLQLHLDEYGYYFCTKCKRNDCKPIDCAHTISVNECINMGMCELSYDIKNIELVGRKCHQEQDGLNLIFNNK